MSTTPTPDDFPVAPDGLSPEEHQEWARVCSEMATAGSLSRADRAILTIYVSLWKAQREASEGVAKHGAVIKYSNGMVGPSPFFKVQKETAQQLRGLLNDLGLTPASRGFGASTGDGGDSELPI